MSVTVTHREYDLRVREWRRIASVLAGRDAILDAGEEFVPVLSGQNLAQYQAYLMRGLWFGATQRTHKGIVGLVFSQDPQYSVPANIAKFIPDVTNTDVSLEEFAKDVFSEAIAYNWGGILVDVPPEEDLVLPSDSRPYLTYYNAYSVRWWKQERIRGKLQTTVVILEETDEDPIPGQEYGTILRTNYRVLKLAPMIDERTGRTALVYRQEEWEEVEDPTDPINKNKEWRLVETIFPKRKGNFLDFIPFTFTTTEGVQPHICKSEMLDLADMNLDHWRLSVDLRHGLHFTALPTPCASAVPDGESLRIGSESAWTSTDPNFKSWYLEFSGQGIKAIEDAIERDEHLMSLLGSRLLETQKRAAETAEAMVIRQASEDSVIMSAARSVEKAIEKSLQSMSWWMGEEYPKVNVSLTQSLQDLQLTTADMIVIMRSYQSGLISEQSFLEALIRKQYIRGRNWSEEAALPRIDPELQLVTGTGLQMEEQQKVGKQRAMLDRSTVITGDGVTNDRKLQSSTGK